MESELNVTKEEIELWKEWYESNTKGTVVCGFGNDDSNYLVHSSGWLMKELDGFILTIPPTEVSIDLLEGLLSDYHRLTTGRKSIINDYY